MTENTDTTEAGLATVQRLKDLFDTFTRAARDADPSITCAWVYSSVSLEYPDRPAGIYFERKGDPFVRNKG